jgi:hypothetical protein
MLEQRVLSLQATEPFDARADQARVRAAARMWEHDAVRKNSSAAAADVPSHKLRKSVVVEASVAACFEQAANLERYLDWCAGSGLQEVAVCERSAQGRASKVVLTASKFGLTTRNTLLYTYSPTQDEVVCNPQTRTPNPEPRTPNPEGGQP